MTAAGYVKHYADPHRAAAAVAHHAWLASLDSGVRLPRLLDARAGRLTFEHLGHHHPQPHDLPVLADSLGALHAAAHRDQLSDARLDQPFTTTTPGGVLTIRDFFTPRSRVRSLLPPQLASAPVALYKDANIRNFLLTDGGVAVLDFDDLTLAPFGYDLAKLVVSTAMTFGALPPELIDQALTAYNDRLDACPLARCTRADLQSYAEIHHQLTRAYLHRNGYHHPWPQVRPWSAPGPQTLDPPGSEGIGRDGRQR